jgi:hypothetical protein
MKLFFGYLWGVITRPRATFDELARQSSIRPAVTLVIFTLTLAYLNLLLTILSGGDWLGTRRELPDPTYVGFYGRLPVGAEQWTPIWFTIFPILSITSDILTIVLGTLAIRRVQGIPWWAAALISLFGHVLWVYGIMATFVR